MRFCYFFCLLSLVVNLKQRSERNTSSDLYIGNPINQFRLMEHLTIELTNIYKIISSTNSASETIINRINSLNLPTDEDINGVVNGIFRLQSTYRLSTSYFINGNASIKHLSLPMTWSECYRIGSIAYTFHDDEHAYDWIRSSYILLLESGIEFSNHQHRDLLDHLSYLSFMIKQPQQALAIANTILKHGKAAASTHRIKSFEELNKLKQEVCESCELRDLPVESESQVYDDGYEEICRDNYKNENFVPTLNCYFTNNGKSFLKLQPIKLECVSLKPEIYIIHDILTERDIEYLKNISVDRLNRATVRSSNENQYVPASYRISKSSWFSDDFHPKIKHLSLLISAITNLTMEYAEELQIQNYGTGGHFEPHFDFTRKSNNIHHVGGNRIATFMFYMTDVEIGGLTVFPTLGIRVKPVKGSALFWFNLYRSGFGDYSTIHASCPVLMGSKWVANKWIHEAGQEIHRPCSKDPML
ncbi:hypothetical protein GJ496_010087 [Pomphorhynchus laevis]|nr:hypothetical protein GJ496_010087 [Pomphorhynchus laevis]